MKRKHDPDGPEGFLVIDKPAGQTSHDVVGSVRRALGERRVGHGGTLDPDATGVLVVAVGPATRLLRFVADLDKTYTADVVLGTATSTLDASGEVTATAEMSSVRIDDVEVAAKTLTGVISQIPPMVSAIRVGGKRLYELAREGEEIEREAREVTVTRFDVAMAAEPGIVHIEVDCGSGTYVRSLAADLGIALGGVAHLRNLVRTRIGPFGVARAVALGDVDRSALRPPTELIAHLDRVDVDAETAVMVTHGRVLARQALGVAGDGPWTVTSGERLLAVYESHSDGRAKPTLVYAAAPPAPARDAVGDPGTGNFGAMGNRA